VQAGFAGRTRFCCIAGQSEIFRRTGWSGKSDQKRPLWPSVAACGATFDGILVDTAENRIEPACEPLSKKD
jgi:hypothetical protein